MPDPETTIFIQTVTHMKLGVAIPIPNPSFEFWTDTPQVADPLNWTKGGGIVAARVENVSGVANQASIADEGSSAQLSGTSIPANDTMRILSPALQYWHSVGPQLPANMKFYWGIYLHVVSITTPGGIAQIAFRMDVDDNSAFSSAVNVPMQALTAANGSLLRYNGTATSTSNAGDRYAQVWVRLRDAAAAVVVADELGIMFDPFSNLGYTELTNVFPVNGPDFSVDNATDRRRTLGGTMRSFDISGGARNYRLELELSNETLATYQTLRRYQQINAGSPGRPPLPLAIECNIPGVPPMLMVDMVRFGMRRQRAREYYGGVIELETVWR